MRCTSVGVSLTAVLCYAIVCGTPRFSFPQVKAALLRIEGESARPLHLESRGIRTTPAHSSLVYGHSIYSPKRYGRILYELFLSSCILCWRVASERVES
jgi:hypothetical protein